MPATITLKPIEANLRHNTDIFTRMNPYCVFVVENQRFSSQVCKKGGKHPHWSDTVTIPDSNHEKILVEVMDKDLVMPDAQIGSVMMDVQEIKLQGRNSRWYALSYKNKPAGEVLIEFVFHPDIEIAEEKIQSFSVHLGDSE